MKNILVFDSGVGGLSICRELLTTLPDIHIDYLSDNAGFPYGEKSESWLIERVNSLIESALTQLDIDLIVIACNTASTVTLPSLRTHVSQAIIGVVPAIKSAASISKTQTFGLLATPGTVARQYTRELITQYANAHTVISVGSSELVVAIEDFLHGKPLDTQVIDQVIETLTNHNNGELIDTVVLGCTHFPLIVDEFLTRQPDWQWIDSGSAIVARAADLLSLDTSKLLVTAAHSSKGKNAGASSQHQAWFTAAAPLSCDKLSGLTPFLKTMGFVKMDKAIRH